jgi:hypothetical protein
VEEMGFYRAGPEEAGIPGLAQDVTEQRGGVAPGVGGGHRRGSQPAGAMTM